MKRPLRAGVPAYTYKQDKTEEKNIYRRLAIIGGITVVLLFILWFWGIAFIRIIGTLGTNNNDSISKPRIEIPLQPPSLGDFPEFTNKDKISLSGTTSPQAKLKLIVNGAEASSTIADTGGNFSFVDVSLKDGINILKVKASNSSGEGKETRVLITLDKTKPSLTVISPTNGQGFPKNTTTISIKGKTDPDATVLINSIQAITDKDGNFSYDLSASPGSINIEITASDEAGNAESQKLVVTIEK